MCLLWGADLRLTLLVDVNHTESQEDMVSSWEPAHSLMEDAAAPCLLALAVVKSSSGWGGAGSQWLALLWYLFNPLF